MSIFPAAAMRSRLTAVPQQSLYSFWIGSDADEKRRETVADCENRIVVGRHRRAVLGGPGAMKERLPVTQEAAGSSPVAPAKHSSRSPFAR